MSKPNIYFMCVHKGASTFIAQHLFPSLTKLCPDYTCYSLGREYIDWFHANKDSLNLEPTNERVESNRRLMMMFDERPLPTSGTLVNRLYPNHIAAIRAHLNDDFPPANSKMFVMRRDPRDALVSMYYSKAFSHSPKGMLTSVTKEQLDSRLQTMRRMGVYTWIDKALRNPNQFEVVDEFTSCAELIAKHDNIVDLPYELLVSKPKKWLDLFVEHAGLTNIVNRKWRKEMQAQLVPPTTVDKFQHKRRVTPGNWREVFDNRLSELMKGKVGCEMEQLDYHWD